MLLCGFKSCLGLESSGCSTWHFLKLGVWGFLLVLRFPSLLHRLMVQPIKLSSNKWDLNSVKVSSWAVPSYHVARNTRCCTWQSAWCVARDLQTIAPGPLECTCWRRFAAQWGDCKNLDLRFWMRESSSSSSSSSLSSSSSSSLSLLLLLSSSSSLLSSSSSCVHDDDDDYYHYLYCCCYHHNHHHHHPHYDCNYNNNYYYYTVSQWRYPLWVCYTQWMFWKESYEYNNDRIERLGLRCFQSYNNNNNRIQRRYSRFFTISSQRREPSPTRTLKWPGRNRVQITCNTSSAYHVQVSCYVPLGTKGQLSY